MSVEESVHVVVHGNIDAPAAEVFPLVCPIGEYKWIPGWKCQIVHCPNDRVELGTIFHEYTSAPFMLDSAFAQTTWTAVFHDPENYQIHFRMDTEHTTSLYKPGFAENPDGGCAYTLDLTFTPIDTKGAELVASDGRAAKIELMLSALGAMLKTYAETGRMISRRESLQKILTSPVLSPIDKAHLAMNAIRMRVFKDPNRERMIKQWSAEA
jgi:hypothetical protein